MALCRFSSIARQGSIVAQHWLWPFGVSGSSDHCFRCWAKGGLVAGYLPHGNSPRPMIKHSQNRGLLGDLHIFWDHGMKLFDHGLGVFHTLGDGIIGGNHPYFREPKYWTCCYGYGPRDTEVEDEQTLQIYWWIIIFPFFAFKLWGNPQLSAPQQLEVAKETGAAAEPQLPTATDPMCS